MSLDLEKHLVFYGAYHSNPTNWVIHMCCVPLILFSGLCLASTSPILLPLPSWLTVPYLPPNAGTIVSIIWGALYILLEPVAGAVLAAFCLGGAATGNWALGNDKTGVTQWALGIHIAAWILQFFGHSMLESRAPPLLDSVIQAVFLAPLHIWLEFLFKLGYRQELKSRVKKGIQKQLAKFRAEDEKNAAAAKNGKAE